jgi:hypothetical protein
MSAKLLILPVPILDMGAMRVAMPVENGTIEAGGSDSSLPSATLV